MQSTSDTTSRRFDRDSISIGDRIGSRTAAPTVGSIAPTWNKKTVVDGRIRELSSHQLQSEGQWLLLLFIPMAWSYVCPTEVTAFARRSEDLKKRHCSVAFCSTDSEFVLRAWGQSPERDGGLGGVTVPLVSDRNQAVSRAYGVLIEEEGVARRAMFIIDPSGTIRQVTCNDVNIGRSVDEAFRLVDALKFADEFGEGCPADWREGDGALTSSERQQESIKQQSNTGAG